MIEYLAGIAVLLGSAMAGPGSVHVASSHWEQMRSSDARAAAIVHRLATASAPLCARRMPATGLVLHAIDQYPKAQHAELRATFGFETPLSVEAVLPGSPAALAGVRANDGIRAIAGKPVELKQTAKAPTSATRDIAERSLAALPADVGIDLELVRGGMSLRASIQPLPACRTRFELVTGRHNIAHSDGEIIQLSAGYLERLGDEQLAVILAHELAHTMLDHRRRIAEVPRESRRGKLEATRHAEDEADILSVYLLRNAGYDPAIAPRYRRSIERRAGSGDRSHASPAERALALEAEIARIPADAPRVYAPQQLLERRNERFRK